MSADRERAVTEAFVSIANSLVDGGDVVDLLSRLTASCAQILDVASAGLLLADPLGVLHVVAASSERTRDLELFQVQRDEGPCRDCFHSGAPVSVADLSQERARWPQFTVAADAAGFVAVHAVPMRLRDSVLGALGLFSTTVGVLNLPDLALAQALAHVASVTLIAEKSASDKAVVSDQLQTALVSRIVIEQAKGFLAQFGTLDMEQSFAVLRRYSGDHNLRLSDVARSVLAHTVPAQQLLDHARSKDAR